MNVMRRLILLTILAMPLLPVSFAAACPNCKDSVPNSAAEQAANLPGGFNSSIYFMLGGVITVGGLVIRMIVKETRS
jgi:hypothetical protein